MKVLVFGGSGVIGSRFVKEFDAPYTYFKNKIEIPGHKAYKVDIRDRTTTTKIIEKIKPDTIVHAAAVQSMDMCETDRKLAYELHVNGTKNIVEGSKKIGAKVVFV